MAIAECCFDKSLGASINLKDNIREDALLFGESQCRYVVSIKKEDRQGFMNQLQQSQVEFQELGMVGGDKLTINIQDRKILEEKIEDLKLSWQEALECQLQ